MLNPNSSSANMTAHGRLSSAIAKFTPGRGKGFVVPPTSPSEFPLPLLFSNSETRKRFDNQRCNKVPFRSPALFPANINFSQRIVHVFDLSEEEEPGREDSNENLEDALPILKGPTAPRKKRPGLIGFSFSKSKAKPASISLKN